MPGQMNKVKFLRQGSLFSHMYQRLSSLLDREIKSNYEEINGQSLLTFQWLAPSIKETGYKCTIIGDLYDSERYIFQSNESDHFRSMLLMPETFTTSGHRNSLSNLIFNKVSSSCHVFKGMNSINPYNNKPCFERTYVLNRNISIKGRALPQGVYTFYHSNERGAAQAFVYVDGKNISKDMIKAQHEFKKSNPSQAQTTDFVLKQLGIRG